jgi:hypothetical protein
VDRMFCFINAWLVSELPPKLPLQKVVKLDTPGIYSFTVGDLMDVWSCFPCHSNVFMKIVLGKARGKLYLLCCCYFIYSSFFFYILSVFFRLYPADDDNCLPQNFLTYLPNSTTSHPRILKVKFNLERATKPRVEVGV